MVSNMTILLNIFLAGRKGPHSCTVVQFYSQGWVRNEPVLVAFFSPFLRGGIRPGSWPLQWTCNALYVVRKVCWSVTFTAAH